MKKILLLTILFTFTGYGLMQAAPSPPAAGGAPPCWPPPCIPIDGGVVFLLAAGLGLGAKKTISYYKEKRVL